jgi:tetratricopeptide (TPR) repeat protein
MYRNRKLPHILLDLHKTCRSGVLRIERGAEKKQLVLNNGLLVFAESNLPAEHLARIMVKMDLIPRAEMNEIASLMKTGKTSEEAILALSGSGMKDLEKGRYEQATVILASLWAWKDCDIRLYPADGLVRCQLNLSLPLPELMVLSARRAVSDHLIPFPSSFLEKSLCVAEDFAEKAPDYPLNNAESYAYSLLRTPLTAADVLPLVPEADVRPEELLLRLWVLGLITIKEPDAQTGESPAATESNAFVQQLEDILLRFQSGSLYEVLSIPTEASPDEIQVAYHGLAKQYHPDRFQSKEFSEDLRAKVERIFALINEAYITLKDPASRVRYDEERHTKESKVEAELKARAGGHSEDEKTAEVLYRDARMLLTKGDFEKAIERLKGCVWLSPKKAVYHHYLGVALGEIPKLRKSAEQHFLKAIELDSLSADSHLELAKLYIKVMLPRKASLQLQELMRWDPDNLKAQKLMAELKNLSN